MSQLGPAPQNAGGIKEGVFVGDSIDALRQDMHRMEVDLNVPVKHGLSLNVTRFFSSSYYYGKNRDGYVNFGYAQDEEVRSNWHLGTYEARIMTSDPCSCDPEDNMASGDLLAFVTEEGGRIHFGYNSTDSYSDSDKLQDPYSADWGASVYASLFYPIGDPRSGEEEPYDQEKRQTSRDLELYILHDHDPEDAADRIDPENILGFVLRDKDTGYQLHFNELGNLRFLDKNYRNNVESGTSGHVDDYLEVTWQTTEQVDDAEPVESVYTVKAPPSDGRYIVFVHPADGGGVYSHVTSVSLVIPSGGGTTTHSNLVRYRYHGSGKNRGRLYRVWRGSTAKTAIQYEYGYVTTTPDPNPTTLTTPSESFFATDLCMVSEVTDTSGGICEGGGTCTVKNLIAFQRWSDGSSIAHMRQWTEDTGTGTTAWRENFELEFLSPAYRLTWKDGKYVNGTNRYHSGASDTYTDFYNSYHHDLERFVYGNTSNEPPSTRITYQEIDGDKVDRLVEAYQLKVATDDYVDTVNYEYVDEVFDTDTGTWNQPNGLNRVASVTKYPDYEYNGTLGEYVADEDTKLVTSYSYSDTDLPEAPSQIDGPGGSRVIYNYNNKGQLLSETRKQWNSATSTYDTIEITDYEYITTGTNSGLLSEITRDPQVGHTVVTTFNYSSGSTYAGRLVSVVADDRWTTYTYDAFNNILSTETEEGTATNTYTGSGQSDTYLPPRLLETSDLASNETRYAYNNRGLIYTVTAAYGTGLARTTTYTYDDQWNMIQVSAPGEGDTVYSVDIYRKPIKITDAEGTVTKYEYDGFARVTRETVDNSSGTNAKYKIEYTYVSAATGCGSCGTGATGASLVEQRKIINASSPGTYEIVYYDYDLLGRKRGEGDASSADDFVYTYDGVRLTEIAHSGLWGTQSLVYEYDKYGRRSAEVYPNGRKVEFGYDSGTPAPRLAQIKDAFGYITKYVYDSDDRLTTSTHSSLGTAVMAYNSDDLVTKRTLGNGAYTDYTYDSINRLTAWDNKEDSGTRLLKHDWGYDALGRKTDPNITMPANTSLTGWDLEYDSANRLTREWMNGDSNYGTTRAFDDVGNPTSYYEKPGTTNEHTIAYGTGNRETSATYSGGSAQTKLVYDYKGNVTQRYPLASTLGNAYNYTWDAWDRMTTVTLSGQNDVGYEYDAGGRLLRRNEDLGESVDRTYTYWLGLNKLAEERGGEGSEVLRASPEVGPDPDDDGWYIYSDDAISYPTDTDRGKVTRLTGDAYFGMALGVIGDSGSNFNPNDTPFDTPNKTVGLWVRNADGDANPDMIMTVVFVDDQSAEREARFYSGTGTDAISGSNFDFYIGDQYEQSGWNFFEVDLQAKIDELDDTVVVDELRALAFIGEDLYVDDIILGTGTLEKSYQHLPMAPIAGCLGAQSGSRGGDNQDPWAKWYYHYNEMGTVVATTDADGDEIGVYEPQYFGVYKIYSGTRPDSLGLQSKFYDSAAGLYYFHARWYDPQRGRWMSKDPLGYVDGWNLYEFVNNIPASGFDPTGKRDWGPFGGTCCNSSSGYEWALVNGSWIQLAPGQCTGGMQDCDGQTCGGGFYAVYNLENGDCATPGCDDPDAADRRWTPSGPNGPDAESPSDRGAKPPLPPWYDWI